MPPRAKSKFLLSNRENNTKKTEEMNILSKQLKKVETSTKSIDLNTKSQLEILQNGFKDLNQILRILLESNINKEEFNKMSLKIEAIKNQSNKCNHLNNLPILSTEDHLNQ